MTTRTMEHWSLHFERDGTEDVAIIIDGDVEELLRSRPFWLPGADDPVPPTFAAMRLIAAAPALLSALRDIMAYAENEARGLETLQDSPEAEAEAETAWKAVEAARAVIARVDTIGIPPASGEPDIAALLAARRQVAALWSVDDVLEVRPDLTADQGWEVLQTASHDHDS